MRSIPFLFLIQVRSILLASLELTYLFIDNMEWLNLVPFFFFRIFLIFYTDG